MPFTDSHERDARNVDVKSSEAERKVKEVYNFVIVNTLLRLILIESLTILAPAT